MAQNSDVLRQGKRLTAVTSRDSKGSDIKSVSLRLPDAEWKKLNDAAEDRGVSQNQFLRDLLANADSEGAIDPDRSQDRRLAVLLDADAFTRHADIDLAPIQTAIESFGKSVTQIAVSTSGGDEIEALLRKLRRNGYEHVPKETRLESVATLAIHATKAILEDAADGIFLITHDPLLTRAILNHIAPLYAVVVGDFTTFQENCPIFNRAERVWSYDHLINPPAPDQLFEARKAAAHRLLGLIAKNEERGVPSVGSLLAPKIRGELAISLTALEFERPKDLAEFMAGELGWVEMNASGMDWRLKMTNAGRAASEELARDSHRIEALRQKVEGLKEEIERAIGMPLPSRQSRLAVWSALVDTNSSFDEGPLTLIELSYVLLEELRHIDGISQDTIFRLLNGLVFAGGFDFHRNPEQPNNPTINGLRPLHDNGERQNFDSGRSFFALEQAWLLNLAFRLHKTKVQLDPVVFSETVLERHAEADQKIAAAIIRLSEESAPAQHLDEMLFSLQKELEE